MAETKIRKAKQLMLTAQPRQLHLVGGEFQPGAIDQLVRVFDTALKNGFFYVAELALSQIKKMEQKEEAK